MDQLALVTADESPDSIRARIPALKQRIDHDYMRLARDLWLVYHRGLYLGWGYETYDDYVTQEAQTTAERAGRLRRLWSRLVLDAQIRPSELDGVGYTNALLLVQVVNRDNAKEWISTARQLPYRALQARIDATRPPAPPPALPAQRPTTATPAPPDAPALPAAPLVKPAKRRVFYLHDEQDQLIDEAIAEANRESPSSKEGYLLSCVALEFLAGRMSKEGRDERLGFYLRHLERVYGGRLIHFKTPKAFDLMQTLMEQHPEDFTHGESRHTHQGQAQADPERAQDACAGPGGPDGVR